MHVSRRGCAIVFAIGAAVFCTFIHVSWELGEERLVRMAGGLCSVGHMLSYVVIGWAETYDSSTRHQPAAMRTTE